MPTRATLALSLWGLLTPFICADVTFEVTVFTKGAGHPVEGATVRVQDPITRQDLLPTPGTTGKDGKCTAKLPLNAMVIIIVRPTFQSLTIQPKSIDYTIKDKDELIKIVLDQKLR